MPVQGISNADGMGFATIIPEAKWIFNETGKEIEGRQTELIQPKSVSTDSIDMIP